MERLNERNKERSKEERRDAKKVKSNWKGSIVRRNNRKKKKGNKKTAKKERKRTRTKGGRRKEKKNQTNRLINWERGENNIILDMPRPKCVKLNVFSLFFFLIGKYFLKIKNSLVNEKKKFEFCA